MRAQQRPGLSHSVQKTAADSAHKPSNNNFVIKKNAAVSTYKRIVQDLSTNPPARPFQRPITIAPPKQGASKMMATKPEARYTRPPSTLVTEALPEVRTPAVVHKSPVQNTITSRPLEPSGGGELEMLLARKRELEQKRDQLDSEINNEIQKNNQMSDVPAAQTDAPQEE